MKNISDIKSCYGCGVCAIACPRSLISVTLDNSGFYRPVINTIKDCTNCGLCVSVCSYQDQKKILADSEILGYAVWSNDIDVRSKCSSGGIAYELGRQFINKGYKSCGVRYNIKDHRAEHYIASTVGELEDSVGSKYLQSYTLAGFSKINRNENYIIFGTPCQIDSYRKYINKFKTTGDFILVDFFCHGVPSKKMWYKYLSTIQVKDNASEIYWRNKRYGWHNSWAIGINVSVGEEQKEDYFSLFTQGDMFFKMFLSDCCLGSACYDKCKYKLCSSSADIRLGDLWGTKYNEDQEGVSGVLAITELGDKTINSLSNVTVLKENVAVVTESQMKKSPRKPARYNSILNALESEKSLKTIYFRYVHIYIILKYPFNLFKRVINKMKRILGV
ncbi:MAG: Coenzyme F420 hydrogenase/dehydrogenase, beta subunit C-terminal domain [Rikenellaceae bacterium]